MRLKIVLKQVSGVTLLLVGVLALGMMTFVSVMFFPMVELRVGSVLGLERKNDILTFVGVGMGGVLVALQSLMSYKRAKALEETATAQLEASRSQAKATLNAEQGQRQERMKSAIEHLGSTSSSVRLGGAYELFYLADDVPKLRQSILDILCAHIRELTGQSTYREAFALCPSEEVQSILTLLFVQESLIFRGCGINLRRSYLRGAELSGAYLQRGDLAGIQLHRATLSEAQLQDANLYDARLQGAYLVRAELSGAFLCGAQLQRANLGRARMRGANLSDAKLQFANLALVQFQGSLIGNSQMQEAHLHKAQFQGVRCEDDVGSFEDLVMRSIGQESDLSWAVFSGGLESHDLDRLVEDLPDDEARKMRTNMAPHMFLPRSGQLPMDCEAVIGSYTEREAKDWIVEHQGSTGLDQLHAFTGREE